FRRDGATRGGSARCFLYCGGHGASPRPAASCDADSSRSASRDSAALSMPADASPRSANRAGAVASVNAAGSQSATSSHSKGIDTRVGRGPHRPRRGYGPVLGVLVVVEEDPTAFLLPPF